jgi:putative NIF3 family GTP cyclohydrolase 1 type 2
MEAPVRSGDLAESLGELLQRETLHLGDQCTVHRLAWCTGAAQGYIEQAARAGYDAFISGEVSEQTYHQARELGVAYLAAGHHATERFGVQALGAKIGAEFGVAHHYVELENPV